MRFIRNSLTNVLVVLVLLGGMVLRASSANAATSVVSTTLRNMCWRIGLSAGSRSGTQLEFTADLYWSADL
jgi:hypothetical protein